jgi:hypothetical protein
MWERPASRVAATRSRPDYSRSKEQSASADSRRSFGDPKSRLSTIERSLPDAGATRLEERWTLMERLLVLLSRYREASIAVVAIALIVYFQIGSGGGFLSPQFMSVVLRDTGRLGLIAVAEVMLMITGEIDLSVSGTFSIAPYLMVLMSIAWGVPLWLGATIGIGIVCWLVSSMASSRFDCACLR